MNAMDLFEQIAALRREGQSFAVTQALHFVGALGASRVRSPLPPFGAGLRRRPPVCRAFDAPSALPQVEPFEAREPREYGLPRAVHVIVQEGARLMARTFGFDVLACPRCGGCLRLIALIDEAAVIDRILRHLGVPTEVPAPRPARAPPCPEGTPDQAGWDDDRSVFNSCS